MGKEDENDTSESTLSIDETNALRAKLGLKPLEVGASSKSAGKKEAEDRFLEHKEQLQREKEEQILREKVERAKVKRKLKEKMKGKGLGEAQNDEEKDLDPVQWVERMRKKELAAKKQKELDLQDQIYQEKPEEYSSNNLQGLKIGHSLNDIRDEGEVILTLKDSAILEDNGDELVNVNIMDTEKTRENIENRKKKPVYKGYDDEEFETGERTLLSQYDEEIYGKNKKSFVLGEKGLAKAVTEEERKKELSAKLKMQAISLQESNFKAIQDYYTKEEVVQFKKPKKKKKVRGKKKNDNNEPNDSVSLSAISPISVENSTLPMEVDSEETKNDGLNEEVNFVDDDELQAALAKTRRLALKQRPAPEDIVAKLKETKDVVAEQEIEGNEYSASIMQPEEDSGLILSETTEFVRYLPTMSMFQENKRKEEEKASASLLSDKSFYKGKKGEYNQDSEEDAEGMEIDGNENPDKNDEPKLTSVVEEEPLVAEGLAATLTLLTQKGFVEKISSDQMEVEKSQLQRRKWLAEQRKSDLLREHEEMKEKEARNARNRSAGGGGGGSRHSRDRDYSDRDSRLSYREVEEKFKDYKPDIRLEYHDEFGRSLNPKEAFRELSHKFHGKASGKLKTEKRLRKLEEELKLQKMSSTDTPLQMASALQQRQQQTGNAFVTLSVGNRTVLPPEISLSDKKAKVSEGGKKKGKGSKHQTQKAPVQTSYSAAPVMIAPPMTNAEYVAASQALTAKNDTVTPTTSRPAVSFGIKRKAPDGPKVADAFEEGGKKK